jgi:D-xylose transport system permease protein
MRGRAQSTDQRARAGALAPGRAAPAAPGPRAAAPAAGGPGESAPGRGAGRRAAVLAAAREVPASRMQMAASVAALVAVAAIFQVQTSLFLSPRNVTELLLESIQVGVMALGLTFVLLLGEIDLSVAGLSAVCATVTASAIVVHHMSTGVGITLGLAAGVAFGLVQALIISVFGAPSLIVTLGGSLVLSGLLLVILPTSEQIPLGATVLGSYSSDFVPGGVAWILIALGVGAFVVIRSLAYLESRPRGAGKPAGRASLARIVIWPAVLVTAVVLAAEMLLNSYLGLPLFLALFVGMIAVCAYITTQTRFGVHLYAVGGSRQAANRAGISPRKMLLSAFAINGFFAAAAGILGASRILGVGVDTNSPDLLLVAIAAAVIGGTSLFGGRGNVWGALIGALLIESLANGLDLLGASAATQYIAEGLVLGVATIIDSIVNRRWIFARTGG